MKRLTYTGWRGADFGDGLLVEPGDTRELEDHVADRLVAGGQWKLAATEAKEPEPKKPATIEKEN